MVQKGFPRCFKTHYWYPYCPKGARYIWCVREPCAVAYSYFRMFQGWFFQPGEVSVEDYVRERWLSKGEPRKLTDRASYFHHLASWWPHRNDPNVLLVFYEDLKEYYESSVHSVAEFIGITDEGCIQVALKRGRKRAGCTLVRLPRDTRHMQGSAIACQGTSICIHPDCMQQATKMSVICGWKSCLFNWLSPVSIVLNTTVERLSSHLLSTGPLLALI